MKQKTHFEIMKYVLDHAPPRLRNFMKDMTDAEILYYCWAPDKIDRDNLTSGFWFHSYKMEKNYKWVRDHLPHAILALYWDCGNKYKEGTKQNLDICCQNLVKMSHYTVDARTMPHVVKKEADAMHEQFEEDIDKTILDTIHEAGAIRYHPLRSLIFEEAIERCKDTYKRYKSKLIKIYREGNSVNDSRYTKLKIEIIRRCAVWTLDALWATYEHMAGSKHP